MRWVDRNASGAICGHYAQRQSWHSGADALSDDDPEIVAFDVTSKAAMLDDRIAMEQLINDLRQQWANIRAVVVALRTEAKARGWNIP